MVTCDHKFVDSANCLKCGIGWDAPKAECQAASQANQDAVPEAVAIEVETACSDDPTNKSHDHFRSRRKLFEEVDRLIRGRVRAVLPDITLEFKQQVDKDLGLDALRRRVATLVASVDKTADQVSRDAATLTEQFEALVRQRVEQLFQQLGEEVTDGFLKRFTERAGAIVAKEVARQLSVLLRQQPKEEPKEEPKVERRVRVKKRTR